MRIVSEPLVSPETFQHGKQLPKGIGVRSNPDLSSQEDILGVSQCHYVPFLRGGEMTRRCCFQVGAELFTHPFSGILGQI